MGQSRYEESEVSAKVKYEKKDHRQPYIKHSSKPFFSYLRSKRKAKVTVSSVSSLRRDDSSETVGAEETAQEQTCYKRI